MRSARAKTHFICRKIHTHTHIASVSWAPPARQPCERRAAVSLCLVLLLLSFLIWLAGFILLFYFLSRRHHRLSAQMTALSSPPSIRLIFAIKLTSATWSLLARPWTVLAPVINRLWWVVFMSACERLLRMLQQRSNAVFTILYYI